MKLKNFLIFFIVLILFFITGCSGQKNFRNDVKCITIAENICGEAEIVGGYSQYTDDKIKYFFDGLTGYDDHAVFYSNEVNDINEFGVFHATDGEYADKIYSVLSDYIDTQKNDQIAFIASYAPREVPKLENAEVFVYGNYVVYLILNDEDKHDALGDIEEILKN